MSSFDKTVKLACKPKAAAPKSKYLDPIIAATWSDDGAVHDVCKALVPRIREPNAIVVFKALIVLHTMIRAGSTDNVLSYLSSSNILRLRNISSANWEGYAAPQNLQNYALYLESRISAFKELKHDAIKVQSESNRDMRNSVSVEETTQRGRKDRKTDAPAPTRSKTIMGRKLRSMTVEKGLLRETKVVHRMVDALVECRFYLDNLEDELTITALQMLVKDLLILFQAGNEGVINVLEHYFQMSHVDAEEALKLYRRFCKQTENAVEYLGVAKKLQNLLNVPVPNLKHAPVSLAGALQEYLDDPNFEQNRIEYKMNKDAVERGTKVKGGKTSPSESTGPAKPLPSSSGQASPKNPEPFTSSAPTTNNTDTQDFFSAIEEEQPAIFNPQTNGSNFQQQPANPFTRMLAVQPTGFLLPQTTAMPFQPNPFGNFLTPQPPQATGQLPFSTFIQQPNGQQPQPTSGLPVPQLYLQPQMTGSNPFRQTALVPQTTGMQLFGVGSGAFPVPPLQQSQTMMNLGQTPTGLPPAPISVTPFSAPRPSFGSTPSANSNMPARPSSTPLTSTTVSSTLQAVKSHQTGTKNPFGPVSPPPVPKPPTLFELSTGLYSQNQGQNASSQLQQTQQQQQPSQPSGPNPFSFAQSSLNPGAADISSVASSFAFANGTPSTNSSAAVSPSVSNTTSSTAGSDSLFLMPHSSQPTSVTSATLVSSTATPTTPFATGSTRSISPVKSHVTGFTGLKPFKPTSSFGASLLESLPPIAGSGPTTPAVTGNTYANSSAISPTMSTTLSGTSLASGPQNITNFPFLNNEPTGATGGFGTRTTLGVGLRPQMTGGGGANPFRASVAAGALGSSAIPPIPALPTGFGGMNSIIVSGISSSQPSQQPNAATSLI